MKIERDILLDNYGKWLWRLRLMPEHAAHFLTGVFLPPHEITWLKLGFAGYTENVIVASRGTSKSFVATGLLAPLMATLRGNRGILVVSASGFRGGKLLFKDVERLFHGDLKSQQLPGAYLMASLIKPGKVIQKDPASWTISLASRSHLMTVPTHDEDTLRGIRTNILFVDERNTFDGKVVQKVLRPMLNVGTDFRRPAAGSQGNQVFSISTIDYTVRDWYPEIHAFRSLAYRQFEAMEAVRHGDYATYDRLMNDDEGALKIASFSYSRLDYTDLLIPQTIHCESDGKTYRVNYPLMKGEKLTDFVRYDERDKQFYVFTYPVEKEALEQPLRDGTVDVDLWLAEQRNVFISASGNVYPHELVTRISEKPIYEAGRIPGFKGGYLNALGEQEEEFFAPLMYTCGDPCVLGVDVARETDESSIVVIRLGELAEGAFDPTMTRTDRKGRVLLGKTPWNHICWAEAWGRLPHDQLADKIREMCERYNIIATEFAGGIGMDKRGGGGDVRDNLAVPKPRLLDNGMPDPDWTVPLRIYDPNDEDYKHYRIMEEQEPDKYWGGLRLLATTNQDNQDFTASSKGMMQKNKLYLAYYEPPSKWAPRYGLVNRFGQPDETDEMYLKLLVGYQGIRRLKRQLLLLQRTVTEAGTIRFVTPTKDRSKEDGKKDLWAAMIYGVAMAREHLVDETRAPIDAPDVGPVIAQIGVNRSIGGDNWYKRLF